MLSGRRPIMGFHNQRGQGTIFGVLATLALVLMVAGIVDLTRLWEFRLWGYRVTESAALAGLAKSRNYTEYMATGNITLDGTVAQQDAVAALQEALNGRSGDLTNISYDVRVHEFSFSMGEYLNYPPVARAGMSGGAWAPGNPAVGVYLTFEVRPVLYGWVNGNEAIPIHVFASASIVEAQ